MGWYFRAVSTSVNNMLSVDGVRIMHISSFTRITFIFTVCCSTLLACQSTESYVSPSKPLFYDQGFTDFNEVNIETEEQVFYLDDTAKAFIETVTPSNKNKIEQMEALVKAIFDHSNLDLLYSGNANTVANETFRNRAANCLSLSIMTYALAREAGFKVDFQEIMIPEYWTRREGFSLLNGHINLKLLAPQEPNLFVLQPRSYHVDFDPQSSRRSLPRKTVGKQAVLAMFYNNKAADALLAKDYTTAYAYFREALTLNPKFNSAWINLGILYRLSGYFEEAKNAYLHALSLNPESLTAWENLAYLYTYTGQSDLAEEILTRVERKRNDNPYYHVNLGEQKMEQHNWDEALAHFRNALSLDRTKHEVYFGLARAYFQIGELQTSERYLKLAKNKARNRQDGERYQSKLDFISRL